jgi:uridine phosphorylase
MNTNRIPDSEFIINDDGSAFHIHVKPEQLTDNIIVCGDPGRVTMIASHFDTRDWETSSREFHGIGGTYHGKPIMALSHGIGPDNIDIVMTELDGLANIDFATRTPRAEHRTLNIVRIGTSGGLQPYVPVGTPVIASKAIGFDGVINYYADRNKVADLDFEREFCKFVKWNELFAKPYVVDADPWLVEKIGRDDMVRGYTVACGGFYGPQGRQLRAPIADPEQNEKIESFDYDGMKICNFEMESSALAGLSALLGHRAMTCCMVIANRYAQKMNTEYKNSIDELILKVLDRI